MSLQTGCVLICLLSAFRFSFIFSESVNSRPKQTIKNKANTLRTSGIFYYPYLAKQTINEQRRRVKYAMLETSFTFELHQLAIQAHSRISGIAEN